MGKFVVFSAVVVAVVVGLYFMAWDLYKRINRVRLKRGPYLSRKHSVSAAYDGQVCVIKTGKMYCAVVLGREYRYHLVHSSDGGIMYSQDPDHIQQIACKLFLEQGMGPVEEVFLYTPPSDANTYQGDQMLHTQFSLMESQGRPLKGERRRI